jgi:DNA-binding transcriptional regulator LsrR (DeoR family)
MPNVDDILESYGLTRATATDYIRYIVGCNQTETARQIDVSRDTINRYKKAFNKMTEIERTFLIYTLMEDHYTEILHDTADADARQSKAD